MCWLNYSLHLKINNKLDFVLPSLKAFLHFSARLTFSTFLAPDVTHELYHLLYFLWYPWYSSLQVLVDNGRPMCNIEYERLEKDSKNLTSFYTKVKQISILWPFSMPEILKDSVLYFFKHILNNSISWGLIWKRL